MAVRAFCAVFSVVVRIAFASADVAGSDIGSCVAGSGPCSAINGVQKDHVLLQSAIAEHNLLSGLHRDTGKRSLLNKRASYTSDCASRLKDYAHQGGAACIVVQHNRAVLVKVPYGMHPGWDLPGGLGDKGNEAGCETAEREVCEETGMQVRVVKKLSHNVFECEVIAENVCTKAVDEGFLDQGWFYRSQLSSLDYRSGSWGDKLGLLKRVVQKESVVGADECGCVKGETGWSSSKQRCSHNSATDATEAAECLETRDDADACGCIRGQDGWSSSLHMCHPEHETETPEIVECSRY